LPGTLPQTPLGELTALPQTPSWNKGDLHVLLKVKEWVQGRERKRKEGEGRGRKREEREREWKRPSCVSLNFL